MLPTCFLLSVRIVSSGFWAYVATGQNTWIFLAIQFLYLMSVDYVYQDTHPQNNRKLYIGVFTMTTQISWGFFYSFQQNHLKCSLHEEMATRHPNYYHVPITGTIRWTLSLSQQASLVYLERFSATIELWNTALLTGISPVWTLPHPSVDSLWKITSCLSCFLPCNSFLEIEIIGSCSFCSVSLIFNEL